MALAENWETFIRLHGGEAGARDMFEKAMEELLRAENPGKEVHLVRASRGDGGIDVYVHQGNGIDVYQCKFFMGSMNDSRWAQVRNSFGRAVEFFNSDAAGGVKMLRWYLCLPREMQKEDIDIWDKFCKNRKSYRIDISLIDGNEIIQRMKKCDRLKDTDFISRYFTVPASVRDGLKAIPKCLTSIPMVDQSVGLVGREEVLKTILSMLEGQKRLALVSGLGGIGKTAVMQHVCNGLKDKGNYVAWINCGGSLKEDFLSLSDAFGIHDEDPDTAYKMIISAIKTQLDGSLYLFMDNLARQPGLDELSILNSLNAHVMVTSRQKHTAFPSIDLDVLGPEEALTMFFKYYNGDMDRHYAGSAREIVTSVGRHTLLVELLAKAAARAGGTLEKFSRDLADRGVFDVFRRKLETAHDGDENRTIEDCVKKLYEMTVLSEDQQRIMKLFSIFTPEKEIYWKAAEWAGLDMDAVDELVSLAWLGRSGLENNFTIHQIIRDSLVRQLKKNEEVLKIEEYGDLLAETADTDSYMPVHLEYTKVRERITFAEDIAKHLMERTAGLLISERKSGQEETLLKRASLLFNNLAGVFRNQGDYEKALEYYRKALVIIERVSGTGHPDTAATYNNMANVFRAQGDYDNALEYYGKALEIQKHVLDSKHPATATTYNNMALVYSDQGDYDKALEYHRKALKIRESVLGTGHPDTAVTYNNMAVVFDKQGDYEKALNYYGKALEIRESVLGTGHPDTAVTYNNMALLFRAKGDYDKALEYYRNVLKIHKSVLYPGHPNTAAAYNNMALVYSDQGDYDKALEYYRKAQEIQERVLGTGHPDTAMTYNNIALVLHAKGDYNKALVYFGRALEIQERVLGTRHPDTAMTYNNIALVFHATGDYDKALEYYRKVLEIRERVLGTGHPNTAVTYNNLAGVFRAQGNYDKALEYYRKALEIQERVLGIDHPSTATTYNNMAVVYYAQGDYDKALEYYEKALTVFSKRLGENHPYTKSTRSSVQQIMKQLV